MDEFFLGLGIVSIITLIITFFMDDEKEMIHDIHANLKKSDVLPLKKGQKSTYKLHITDANGNKISYPLTQDSFYFTIAHISPDCEQFIDYMLELWCLSPFNLILCPQIGNTKKTETLGWWQWDGRQHTISLCTNEMEKEVIALVLIHEIAHLRIHTLTTNAQVFTLDGKKVKSPYYRKELKSHGPQFAQIFGELSEPALKMSKLFSSKQKRHLTAYFKSPKKVHLNPLTKCGNIPAY